MEVVIFEDDFILKTGKNLMKYIERFFDRMIEQFSGGNSS